MPWPGAGRETLPIRSQSRLASWLPGEVAFSVSPPCWPSCKAQEAGDSTHIILAPLPSCAQSVLWARRADLAASSAFPGGIQDSG